jgi:DNA-binding CsgD family transcriptional regulator
VKTAAGGAALVEREIALARLDALLDRVRSGAGAALVIEGEAGIGKTALLSAARERARGAGATVVHGCGSELEAGFPFGVFRQCLEPLVVGLDGDGRARLFRGAAALAQAVVADAPTPDQDASLGALHGLYWLLANLADRGPLVMVIDDAHWADEPTLRSLAYLTRRIDSLAMALVIATRPIATEAPAHEVIAALMADPNAELFSLAALSETGVAELVGEAADDAFSRACHHATGGNPFLLAELIRALVEEGVPFTAAAAQRVPTVAPPEVARLTRHRLARLGTTPSALARALALLGSEAPLELASELAELSAEDGTLASQRLTEAGLVEFDRTLRFRHPLLGAAVAATVTPFERDAGHRKAVALLRARGAKPEQIAAQVLAAAPAADSEDVQVLRAAATDAGRRGAPAAAVPLLRRTLEEPLAVRDRTDVLMQLAVIERTAGMYDSAAAHLLEAAQLADDSVSHAQAAVALALTVGPDLDRNKMLLGLLARDLDDADALERELRLRVTAAFVSAAFHAGQSELPAARKLAAEIAELPGDTPGESIALSALFEHFHLSTASETGSLAERIARNADELLASGARDARAHALLVGLRMADRVQTAGRLTERWFELARLQGSEEAFGAASTHSANLNRLRGRLRDSEADAIAAVNATRAAGGVEFVMSGIALADALLSQGNLDEAQTAFDAIGLGEQIPPVRPYLGVLAIRAELRAERRDYDGALADFDEVTRRLGPDRPSGPLVSHLLVAVRCRNAAGDRAGATEGIERALELAHKWGTHSAIGSALRTRARLADRSDAATDDLAAAVEHLERSPRRLEHARALVDLGSILRRAGRRVDSREPLRASYELARECGADALAETARHELAASGIRIRRERLTGVDALTASERRIAELAAEGATNAEIAQALFVTVKTVEMHLTHAYRKLDVNRRSQLPRALAGSAAAKAGYDAETRYS